MIGIVKIASYLPDNKENNLSLKGKFSVSEDFLKNKIGVLYRRVKKSHENTSDLCVEAFKNLKKKLNIKEKDIDCCIVITQNPDYNIPHTSAIVHGKLGLSENCACFDISLGCSGYVYGLSVITSFMEKNNLKNGLLFTADPYSKIINKEDKNTALLFGDAATVTYISNLPEMIIKDATFGTYGKEFDALINKDGQLVMNGRSVFNFTAQKIPPHIEKLLDKNNLTKEDIDLFILHPGSKYIVDVIKYRLGLKDEKVPFEIYNYGNTVSSSIPLILENKLENKNLKRIVISGYGVGLSWASSILERV